MDAIQVDGGITSEASNWVFDEHVAPHFDEHVRKSVPEYDRVQELAATFSDWFTHNGSTVLDFGASTGETIRRIRDRHSKSLDLIGFDNSQAMIEQAAKKGVDVRFQDLERLTKIPAFSYGVALYSLQFLRPQARQRLVYAIAEAIEPGGGFFVVEKVLGSLHILEVDFPMVRHAIESHRLFQTSCWDGLILAAARRGNCETVLSEDFSSNQIYDGVMVVNPFK